MTVQLIVQIEVKIDEDQWIVVVFPNVEVFERDRPINDLTLTGDSDNSDDDRRRRPRRGRGRGHGRWFSPGGGGDNSDDDHSGPSDDSSSGEDDDVRVSTVPRSRIKLQSE